MALRQSGGGLRHDGALFVLVVVTVPFAISALVISFRNCRLGKFIASAATCIFGLTAIGAGITAVWEYRREAVHDEAIQWLEVHLPTGSAVYLSDAFVVPLPTDQSAEAL